MEDEHFEDVFLFVGLSPPCGLQFKNKKSNTNSHKSNIPHVDYTVRPVLCATTVFVRGNFIEPTGNAQCVMCLN